MPFLLRSQETDAAFAVGNLTIAQKSLVPVENISAVCSVWWHFCTWSSVEASGREEWKRSGGRAGSKGAVPSLSRSVSCGFCGTSVCL